MRRVFGYTLATLAFLLSGAIAIGTVVWDIMWTIDAWPDLGTIIWGIPMVTMGVATIAGLLVAPLWFASEKLLEQRS